MRDERDELRRDNARLEEQRRELEEEIAELQRDRERLRRERDRLEAELRRLAAALVVAQRAGKRQAAPFSKGAPVAQPRRSGRRAGRRYGRQGYRPPPPHVDETITVTLPTACPACGGALAETRVADQFQEDLPLVRPQVRRFRIHIGHCRGCGRRVQGRHPQQTSDALGAARTQMGPRAVALLVLLNKRFGLSHGKTAAVLREWFHLDVRASAVTHALHRAARQALPTYTALQTTVRGSPMVSPDETSWKVGGRSWWLWAFVTPTTALYAIQPGRGFAQAARVLGPDYAGVLVRDGWQGYRPFTAAGHQTCLAHLLRRCRELRELYPGERWPRRVATVLTAALTLRDDARRGTGGPDASRARQRQLMQRLRRLIDTAPRSGALYHMAEHLRREELAVFRFLSEPAIDATNWRAEQALRPAVVNRKISGGNRTARGAATQQVLTSVVQTARLRGLSPQQVLVPLLHAQTPVPSPALN